MENQQMDALEAMVQKNQKKQKRILKIVLGIVGGLFLVAIGIGVFLYQSGNVTGTWSNPAISNEFKKYITEELETAFAGDMDLQASETLTNADMKLEVKDNKATTTASMTLNKQAFLDAYDRLIQEEYNKLLAEVEKEASSAGVSKETLLKETFGNDYEATLKAGFPSRESIEASLDESMTTEVNQLNGSYDKKTGEFSYIIFKGEVSQLTHSIAITEVNNASNLSLSADDFKVGDILLYSRKGNTLTFIGQDDYPFELVK